MRCHKGTLELVDAREFLPLFRCRQGLRSWPVIDDYDSVRREAEDRKAAKRQRVSTDESSAIGPTETVDQQPPVDAASLSTDPMQRCLDLGMHIYTSPQEVPEQRRRHIRASVFPPTEEEASWMHLGKLFQYDGSVLIVLAQKSVSDVFRTMKILEGFSWLRFAKLSQSLIL